MKTGVAIAILQNSPTDTLSVTATTRGQRQTCLAHLAELGLLYVAEQGVKRTPLGDAMVLCAPDFVTTAPIEESVGLLKKIINTGNVSV